MNPSRMAWRWMAAAALLAAGLAPCGARAYPTQSPFVTGRLVQVDVYDRRDGVALPVYAADGRNYIVGEPGHEYAVRIRNCTGGRVLVITSVDGINVITGETAAPSQSGYVLDPWGSVEILGWRKSFDQTAAFFFTDLGNSYAARTGRPDEVGVIGVAVFQEKTPPIAWHRRWDSRMAAPPPLEESPSSGAGDASDSRAPSAPMPAREKATRSESMPEEGYSSQPEKRLGKLGTGHGRREESHVTRVDFERATSAPAELVALQYDRRENLAAMGVLPPIYALPRQPEPFPGELRFAPDPGR